MAPKQFLVVGIGASAGGLQALEALFRSMPTDTGLAFVVVTHIARSHESALAEIIGRYTSMPVADALDRQAIEPNHVYVAPAAHVLTVDDGHLQLTPRSSEAQRKPIDVFLGSLAEAYGELAVGIILSGSGNDGTLGVKAIKERGGFTMAQGTDGSAPQYQDMPNTAIATGLVDLAVPVEAMAQRLITFAQSSRTDFATAERSDDDQSEVSAAADKDLQAIYSLLRNQIGHDFSGYKEKTFLRRVRRRMQIVQAASLATYAQMLRDNPDEITALFRDLLIGVTTFFRDSEAFATLVKVVAPPLFENRRAGDTIRVWVPGCATGEEVYSIAIVLREYADNLSTAHKIQLFATDIDDAALAVARSARYPAALLSHVAPARLKRFFTGDDVSYAVNKEIRDMCVFSSHSVIRDPPFSRIDLISCRNLLIYLGAEFQAQVIPVFHFALRPRGYLFLGTSENVSRHADLFTAVDKRQRIFQRRDHVHVPLQFPFFGKQSHIIKSTIEAHHAPAKATINLRRAIEMRVLERFAPAHVVINIDGDILHYSARTGKYLEPAAGLPNRQLLAMARRGLRLELRSVIREAAETRQQVTRENIAVELDDRVQHITLSVEPLGDNDHDPLFLVVFNDVGEPLSKNSALLLPEEIDSSHERLEQELRDTRERLQSTIEEYETAVEELKSSNEELQSINEELQSANEEMETSKEELQSVNEELHTVNAELNSKVEELDRSSSDLRNVFESTQVGTVFLDQELLIRSFTPAITSIFNLISSDCGRPLTDIVSHVDNPDLLREIQMVLERGELLEKNVRSLDGHTHYLMRILPYRRANRARDGVLVTFFDISRVIDAEAQQRTLIEELNHRVRNMLTVVNAIAHQTMRRSSSKESFVEAFTGRIRAMSTAYGVVSREQWGDVPLRDVIAGHLAHYQQDAPERVMIGGDNILCKPNAALALGLVIHEVATNAVKYGALSAPSGHVAVNWSIEYRNQPMLTLIWREEGGPPANKPERKGFGTELVERELTHTLGATVNFQYHSAGLLLIINIPFHPSRIVKPPDKVAGP